MVKSPYYRIFIKEGPEAYLFCRLFQQKSDESLILQIQPSVTDSGGLIGKIEVASDMFDINYEEVNIPVEIDHTTIHASGQSHTKLKDGTYSINYDKDHSAIPLRNLKTIKHLGTLLSREMTTDDVMRAERATDIQIERNVGQNFSVLDILAIPKNVNVNFRVEWHMENEREVQLTVSVCKLVFNGFDVVIFTRSSDQFDKIPSKTLHLPDMNNILPFVIKLDDKTATIKLSDITFDEVISCKD